MRAATAREEDDPPECPSPQSFGIRRLKKLQSIKGIELEAGELVVSSPGWASLCRIVDQGDLGLEKVANRTGSGSFADAQALLRAYLT